MTVLILRKLALALFFWSVLLSSQEFLEYYQPRPDFPKELNDWLAYVQGHRNDFRVIRNIVKRRKAEVDYYDEREADNKLLNDLEGAEGENPQNDIFPPGNILKKAKINPNKQKKRKSNIPVRTRRESDENSFFEHSNSIEIDPKSRKGEIKRSEAKYPDQFINRGKDVPDKREIQIDILNDGKLLKSIKESKDPKSIVLNIQNVEEPTVSVKENIPKLFDSKMLHINYPQRSVEEEDTNTNNKEAATNFKNLFTANENLNTDSSVARDALAKSALIYHVTLPNPNFIVEQSQPNTSILTENNFQRNNFRDMSKYWSDTEKNQLQQGIDFAQETANLRKQQNNQQKTNDGFETARTIVVEHVALRPMKEDEQIYRPQLKRNLQNFDSNVQFGGPIRSTANIEELPLNQLEHTMRSNCDNTDRVFENNLLPLNIHKNARKNYHIMVVTEKDPIEYSNPIPSRLDETINNRVSITLIEPRKDEEPKEETKKEETPVIDRFPMPIYHEPFKEIPTTDPCTSTAKEPMDLNILKTILNDNRETKTELMPIKQDKDDNNSDKSSETGESLNGGKKLKNQYNDIKVPLEPQYDKSLPQSSQEHEKLYPQKNQEEDLDPQDEKSDPEDSQEQIVEQQYQKSLPLLEDTEDAQKNVEAQYENSLPEDTQNARKNTETQYEKSQPTETEDARKNVEIQYEKSLPEDTEESPVKVPSSKYKLGNNAGNSCEGPNCRPYKRFSKVKRHRKHGKKKHKHRRTYDDSSNDYNIPSYKMRQLKSDFKSPDNQEAVEAVLCEKRERKDNSTFKLRQLKAADYIYDADLEAPDEEEAEEPISSERSKRLGANKKDSVEGDYVDEEDSVALKSNVSSKLVKTVDDVFANPRTTVQTDDEDCYYDEVVDKNKNQNKQKMIFTSEDDKANLGRRQHKKVKIPQKQVQNKYVSKVAQNQIREPRASEDLQQLPRFVIEDRLNEENLRKRSLVNQKEKQKNKFPLSSKSFFASSNLKRRDSNESEILGDKPAAANGLDNASTVGDSLAAGDSKDSSGGVTDQSEEAPAISVSAATEECETPVSIGPVCETDNFTKIKVTTMLNLVGETQAELNNSEPSLNEQYQNLEDILVGRLPISIVDSVFKHMKTHPTFKQRFLKGMKRNQSPVSFKNLPEISSKESNKLIRLMSKIINRLQWTTTCQILPNKLKHYLKAITQVNIEDRLTKTKAMEEIDVDESGNNNQSSFIFHSNNGVDNVEDKVRVLKNMLAKYQHLPDNCKPRAEPVKEYIENHLEMLTHVMSNNGEGAHKTDAEGPSEPAHQAAKRNENNEDDSDIIEHELESVGLGKHPNFRPNFDIEALVRGSDKTGGQEDRKLTSKKTSKRDISRETSNQYDRLLEAVKKERIKREGRKRIEEAFGKLNIDDYNGQNSNNEIKEVFENPLVYSF